MPLCTRCTANPYLQAWIRAHGKIQACSVCAAAGEVAADTNEFLYSPVDPDDDGEAAGALIGRLVGIDAALARRVTDIRHADEPVGGSFYDHGPLTFAGRWSHEHSDRWERLKQT